MKPLERIFFKACLMKGDKSIRDICHVLSDYGVTMDLGWFYIDQLPIEYAKMYEEVQRYVRNTKH